MTSFCGRGVAAYAAASVAETEDDDIAGCGESVSDASNEPLA